LCINSLNAQNNQAVEFKVWLEDEPIGAYSKGELLKIRWSDDTGNKVKIRIYKDGSYMTTAAYGLQSYENVNSYDWHMPFSYTEGTYIIRLENTTNTGLISEKSFNVYKSEVSLFEVKPYVSSESDVFDLTKPMIVAWFYMNSPIVGISLWKDNNYIKTIGWNIEGLGGTYTFVDIGKHINLNGDGYQFKVIDVTNPSNYTWSKEFSVFNGYRFAATEKVTLSNHPNPVKDFTNILYNIPEHFYNVELYIYDLNGKLIERNELSDTRGSIHFKPVSINSNALMYGIVADGKIIATRKMILN